MRREKVVRYNGSRPFRFISRVTLFAVFLVFAVHGSRLTSFAATATDDFNRTTLGANWTTVPGEDGGLTIVSNRAAGASSLYNAAYYNAASFTADQCAEVTLVNVSSRYQGPVVRASQSAETYYTANCDSTNGWQLWKSVAGVNTQLGANFTGTPAIGDRLKICAIGTTISLTVNGSLRGSRTDSAIATGRPGLFTYGTGGRLDDWAAYDAGTNGSITLNGTQAASYTGSAAAGTNVALLSGIPGITYIGNISALGNQDGNASLIGEDIWSVTGDLNAASNNAYPLGVDAAGYSGSLIAIGNTLGQVTLTITAPTTDAVDDTCPAAPGNAISFWAGNYRLYRGLTSGTYTETKDITGNITGSTQYTWAGLNTGGHYFAATALNTLGKESCKTAEVYKLTEGYSVTHGTAAIAGLSAAGSAGPATVKAGATRAITGIQQSAISSQLSAKGNAVRSVNGVAALTGVSSMTADNGIVPAYLTGINATASRGNLAASGSGQRALTGRSATAAVGTMLAMASAPSELSGVQAAGYTGDLTATGSASAALTGVVSETALRHPSAHTDAPGGWKWYRHRRRR